MMYVIEFQKRCIQRAHIICILSDSDAPRSKDPYDDVAYAALPDPEGYPAPWNSVTTSMMHGPCGAMNPKSARTVGGYFSRGYPKRSRLDTIDVDGFPEYGRPGAGRPILKNGVLLTNQWVAPRNPWRCDKHNAHINEEICSPADAAKYLYK